MLHFNVKNPILLGGFLLLLIRWDPGCSIPPTQALQKALGAWQPYICIYFAAGNFEWLCPGKRLY